MWLAAAWPAHSLRTIVLTCLTAIITLAIFVTVRLSPPYAYRTSRLTVSQARHAQLVNRRRSVRWPKPPRRHGTPRRGRSPEYYLFVLGSGGHTKEMLMMMDDGFCDFSGVHRRYLISSGDHMSDHHLEDYETQLAQLSRANKASAGSYDKRIVTRARRVHQPLWTTPFTSVRSMLDIFPILLSPPKNEVGRRLRHPTQIFSNGPATGFFVAVAAHLLKLFYLVPEDSMRFVYIESWARITTLSLTGKLLYYTGLADVFYVQHQDVAAKYGLVNAGEMVFNARRPEA